MLKMYEILEYKIDKNGEIESLAWQFEPQVNNK